MRMVLLLSIIFSCLAFSKSSERWVRLRPDDTLHSIYAEHFKDIYCYPYFIKVNHKNLEQRSLDEIKLVLIPKKEECELIYQEQEIASKDDKTRLNISVGISNAGQSWTGTDITNSSQGTLESNMTPSLSLGADIHWSKWFLEYQYEVTFLRFGQNGTNNKTLSHSEFGISSSMFTFGYEKKERYQFGVVLGLEEVPFYYAISTSQFQMDAHLTKAYGLRYRQYLFSKPNSELYFEVQSKKNSMNSNVNFYLKDSTVNTLKLGATYKIPNSIKEAPRNSLTLELKHEQGSYDFQHLELNKQNTGMHLKWSWGF